MDRHSVNRYSATQRALHWLVALLVLTLIPVAFWMADRGEAGLWDGLTGTLYASHKAVGFLVLWLVVWRVVLRFTRRAPAYPDSVSPTVQRLAHAVQRLIYLLLIAMTLLGWAGVTAFPARSIAGGISLPAMPWVPVDQALAKQLLEIHGWFAIALCIIIALHIAGALKYKLIDRDGVFEHMTSGR